MCYLRSLCSHHRGRICYLILSICYKLIVNIPQWQINTLQSHWANKHNSTDNNKHIDLSGLKGHSVQVLWNYDVRCFVSLLKLTCKLQMFASEKYKTYPEVDSTKTIGKTIEIPQSILIFKVNCCLKVHNAHLKLAWPTLGYGWEIYSRQ